MIDLCKPSSTTMKWSLMFLWYIYMYSHLSVGIGVGAESYDEFLLLARRTELRRISLDGADYASSVITASDIQNAIAIDYDPVDAHVYWTDGKKQAIQRMRMDGTHQEEVVGSNVGTPDGLAINPQARTLYWTDCGTKRIETARLDGTGRRVVVSKDLDEPRAIVLDSSGSYMYWTDWGKMPRIERAALDGSGRAVVINTGLGWPNGLAVDSASRKIYWGDAKTHRIETANMDGTGRKVLVSVDITRLFGLTMLGDYIYWTDWQRRSVERVHKKTGLQRKTIAEDLSSVMGVKAVRAKKEEPTEKVLLLARTKDLRLVSLDKVGYPSSVLNLKDVELAIALDFDPVDRYLYWTDAKSGIQRAMLDGRNQEVVIASDVQIPDGLAIDWVHRNLYWSDSGTNRIESARLNGAGRRALVSDGLDEPRAIALDPNGGYMYWTDWGKKPKIERAALDGSYRSILFNTSLGWPNGLAIDLASRLIYWGDSKLERIEVANLDGSERRVLVSGPVFVFGFHILGDYIYWTDWRRKSIERVDRLTGRQRETVADQLADLKGLKAVTLHRHEMAYFKTEHRKTVHTPPKQGVPVSDRPTENILLVSQRTDLRRVSLDTEPYKSQSLDLLFLQNAIALDYDPVSGYVYWTDGKLRTIQRAFLNGSKQEMVIQKDVYIPDGLAIDWVAGEFYWTDCLSDKIETAQLDGSSRRVVISEDLDEPRAIVIDFSRGHMYWTDWGKMPRIERASLDGSGRSVIIDTGLGWPNGLAVDSASRRIYWGDAKTHRIETANMDGTGRRVLVSQQVPHVFGFALFGDYIYWTDWDRRSIQRVNKMTGLQRETIIDELPNLMGLKAVAVSTERSPPRIGSIYASMITKSGARISWSTPTGNFTHYLVECYYSCTVNQPTISAEDLIPQTHVSGLVPGEGHHVYIYTVNGRDRSRPEGGYFTAEPATVDPSTIKLSNITTTSAELTWDDVTVGRADSYYINLDLHKYQIIYVVDSDKMREKPHHTTVENLEAGTTYSCTIEAKSRKQKGAATQFAFTTRPNAVNPDSISVDEITTSSAQVTWDPAFGKFESYVINVDGGRAGPITVHVPKGRVTATVRGLCAGGDFTVALGTRTGRMESNLVTKDFHTRPSAVKETNIHAESITTNSAILTWDAVVDGNSDYYTVDIAPKAGGAVADPSTVSKAPGWVTRHTTALRSLTGGTEYMVTIRVFYAELDSRPASMKFITDPMPVDASSIAITDITASSAAVSWPGVSGLTDGYVVTLQPAAGGARAHPDIVPRAVHSTSLKNLVAGRLYVVTIRALAGRKESAPSIQYFQTPAESDAPPNTGSKSQQARTSDHTENPLITLVAIAIAGICLLSLALAVIVIILLMRRQTETQEDKKDK